MRKTITKLSCAILALLSSSSLCAQITSPSELYGTYEFTADIEITADGQEYADRFSSKCEVKIDKHDFRDLSIIGLAGATDIQGCNLTKSGNIEVFDYNGDGYYLWDEPVLYGNENGESPWGGNQWTVVYTVDPATKNITVTDFTAITVNKQWSTDKILAKFTNCKLTFKEAAVIEANDVSGEYHFKASGVMDGSDVPTECDITLTATDETNRAYSVVFDWGAGFKSLELSASFDGSRLDIPFKDAYLDEAQTLALCNFQAPNQLEGSLTFHLEASGKVFSLTSGLSISRAEKDGEEVKYAYAQWYMAGVMGQPTTASANFAGSYHVKPANFWNMITMSGGTDPYNYDYPQEFDVVIAYDEMMDGYYIEEFMGPDIYASNYGATDCTVEGNTLKIPAGLLMDRVYTAEDYSVMVYHVLYNGLGEPTGTIDLTVNEDGTCTMGDFFLFRDTRTYDASWNSTSEFTRAAFYGDLSVTSGVDDVKATDAAPKVSVVNGVIYVLGEPAPVKVYSTAGALVYSGVTSAVSGLNRGMYIVKVGAAAVKVVL
ncbi:MAG: T9SS type A sorting domain-containing protein [Bacteroidaceae bacterium]|nr:T9SS type A sorting domain-containing protein [Bacteroidaceae bacterium]